MYCYEIFLILGCDPDKFLSSPPGWSTDLVLSCGWRVFDDVDAGVDCEPLVPVLPTHILKLALSFSWGWGEWRSDGHTRVQKGATWARDWMVIWGHMLRVKWFRHSIQFGLESQVVVSCISMGASADWKYDSRVACVSVMYLAPMDAVIYFFKGDTQSWFHVSGLA